METTIDDWMQNAPFAHFLITSRIRFSLFRRAVYQVLPMSEADGVRLFEQVSEVFSCLSNG